MSELPTFSTYRGKVYRTFIEPDTGNLVAEIWLDGEWLYYFVSAASRGHTISQSEAERIIGAPAWPRQMKEGGQVKVKAYLMWSLRSPGRIVETEDGEIRAEIFTGPVPEICKPPGWEPMGLGWEASGCIIPEEQGERIVASESNPKKTEFPRFFAVPAPTGRVADDEVWCLDGMEGGSLTAVVWRGEAKEREHTEAGTLKPPLKLSAPVLEVEGWAPGDPAVIMLKGEPITLERAEFVIAKRLEGHLMSAASGKRVIPVPCQA